MVTPPSGMGIGRRVVVAACTILSASSKKMDCDLTASVNRQVNLLIPLAWCNYLTGGGYWLTILGLIHSKRPSRRVCYRNRCSTSSIGRYREGSSYKDEQEVES